MYHYEYISRVPMLNLNNQLLFHNNQQEMICDCVLISSLQCGLIILFSVAQRSYPAESFACLWGTFASGVHLLNLIAYLSETLKLKKKLIKFPFLISNNITNLNLKSCLFIIQSSSVSEIIPWWFWIDNKFWFKPKWTVFD